jgi:hypothetical protein
MPVAELNQHNRHLADNHSVAQESVCRRKAEIFDCEVVLQAVKAEKSLKRCLPGTLIKRPALGGFLLPH